MGSVYDADDTDGVAAMRGRPGVWRVVGRVRAEAMGGNSGPQRDLGDLRGRSRLRGSGWKADRTRRTMEKTEKEKGDSMTPMETALKMGTRRCRVSCQSRWLMQDGSAPSEWWCVLGNGRERRPAARGPEKIE